MGVRGLSWSLSPVRITESSLDWLILCNPPIRDAEWQMKVFYSLTSDLWVQVKVKHSTEDSLNLCWGNSVLFVFMEMKDMNKFIRMSCSHDWTRILKRVHQNPLRPGLVLTDFVCPCQKRKDSYLKTKQTKKQTKKTQPKKNPMWLIQTSSITPWHRSTWHPVSGSKRGHLTLMTLYLRIQLLWG